MPAIVPVVGRVMRTAAWLALSSVVACASLGKKSTQPDLRPWPEIRPEVRAEALRVRMYEVLDHVRG